jgi:hypothetical protein
MPQPLAVFVRRLEMKWNVIVFVIIAIFLFLNPLFGTPAEYKEEVVIVVNNDDGAPGYVEEFGEWNNSNGTANCPGIPNSTSRYAIQSTNPGATATFTPDIPVADFYHIYYVGPLTANASDHALCVVLPSGSDPDSVYIDQNTSDSCDRKLLGTYYLSVGTDNNVSIINDGTGAGYLLRADLILFTREGIPDTTAPETISDLTGQLHGGAKSFWGNIYLTWSEPFDSNGVELYIIYRSQDPSEIGDSLAATIETFYLDEHVVGHPYIHFYYTVKSIDPAGNVSEPSNQAGEFDKLLRW